MSTVLGNRILADRMHDGAPGYDAAERPIYVAYSDLQNPAVIYATYRNLYDRDGNVTVEGMDSLVKSNFIKNYHYDDNNRLVAFLSAVLDPIEGPVGVRDEKWTLDGENRRVAKVREASRTTYAYRDHDVINEKQNDPSGMVLKDVNYILGENIDKVYGFVDNLTGTRYLKSVFHMIINTDIKTVLNLQKTTLEKPRKMEIIMIFFANETYYGREMVDLKIISKNNRR